MRILFIDDDNSIRQLYTMLLDNIIDDVDIVETISGNRAIKVLNNERNFDIILCDYYMKDGNGDVVFKYLEREKINIPFILFSTENLDTLKGFTTLYTKNPLNAYIKKPISPKKFKLVIEDILRRIFSDFVEAAESKFMKIRYIYFLRFNKVLCDIYIRLAENKYVKFINSNDYYTKEVLKKYLLEEQKFLYITKNDYDSFSVSFAETPFLIQDDNLDVEEIENAVTSTVEIVHNLIQTTGMGTSVVQLVDSCVSQINKSVDNKKNKVNELLKKVRNRKDYINDHSYLVAYVASSICKYLGWESNNAYNKVTYAALLHDSLLDNPQLAWEIDSDHPSLHNLSEEEISIYKNHPIETSKIIEESDSFPQDVELIVAQHHENPEGTGIPRGLTPLKTSPIVAIFIIAHAFVYEMYQVDFNKKKYKAILNKLKARFKSGNYKKPMQALYDNYK